VGAFLAALRSGELESLIAILDPDIVMSADDAAIRLAAAYAGRAPTIAKELRGARAVLDAFKGGRAKGAQSALIDGEAGAVWAHGGQVRGAFVFTIDEGKIVAIDLVVDPARLGQLDVVLQGAQTRE
jgi:RNA polymerase sigma-70 factor (ECF subfamily)